MTRTLAPARYAVVSSFALMAAVAASSALALEMSSEIYVAASVGRSQMDQTAVQRQYNAMTRAALPTLSALNSSQSSERGAFKLQLGHDFTPNWAVEGGYVDLGKTTYNNTYSYRLNFPIVLGPLVLAAQGGPYRAQRTIKVRGWNVSGVGKLPLNDKITGFAKLGLIHAEVATEDVGNDASSFPFRANKNVAQYKWRPTYGLGADYRVNEILGVRAEYEHFSKVGDEKSTGSTDVNLMSVGVTARF